MSASLALARHYLEIDSPGRALETLENAQVDVADPEFWLLRACALVDLDRDREASEAAESGLRIDPDDILLLAVHARAERGRGDLAAAERSLLAALRLEPEDVGLLVEYAILVAHAGQLDKAGRLLDEAARLEPTNGGVVSARGVVAYLAGDDDAAAGHAEEILREDPESAAALLLRGSVHAGRGQARAARRYFDTVARSEPGNENVVRAARSTRWATHPLLWPMIPVARWGQGPVWLGAMALIGIGYVSGVSWLFEIAALGYIAYVVYSWTVPPLLLRWLERRR